MLFKTIIIGLYFSLNFKSLEKSFIFSPLIATSIALITFFVFFGFLFARNDLCKQRLIVTTDLGGADPDDKQSLIHILVCADRMDIEGIISSNAWVDDPDRTSDIT